jgi:ribosomal protein S21
MIYAVRNEGESNEKLVLRYKKLFFQSRIVTKLKKERYVTKDLKPRKQREKAIVRGHYRDLNSKVYF